MDDYQSDWAAAELLILLVIITLVILRREELGRRTMRFLPGHTIAPFFQLPNRFRSAGIVSDLNGQVRPEINNTKALILLIYKRLGGCPVVLLEREGEALPNCKSKLKCR